MKPYVFRLALPMFALTAASGSFTWIKQPWGVAVSNNGYAYSFATWAEAYHFALGYANGKRD